ncbi:hypothetical protein [Oceanicola sp. 22II-s10i]|uniref:beta strand repeat-containing protein n=1 Tax=Oceanicola sp. 22II-s10i TaxID=1317116 RepID=UPI0011319D34|nr:hypothetical protein [Oceanicola sp. 22II-s10i]
MKTTQKLMASVALATLGMSAAGYAGDENETFLVQSGSDNSASVAQQDGNGNTAGLFGSLAMMQDGDFNDLVVTQTGNNNAVGDLGPGVDQIGDRNAAVIGQNTNRNRVGIFQQQGQDGAVVLQNEATVIQGGGNFNLVTRVAQTNDGSTPSGNSVSLEQNGRRNMIGNTGFLGLGVIQTGSGNTADVNQVGNFNGSNGQNGANWDVGTFAVSADTGPATTLAFQATLRQTGTNNVASIGLTGNRNLFALDQNGSQHRLSYSVLGNRNQGAFQMYGGDGNWAEALQMGNLNDTSALLFGNDNFSDISQTGDENIGWFNVIMGDGNTLGTIQSGDANHSSTQVYFGDRNDVTVLQGPMVVGIPLGGDQNRSEVYVEGNDNLIFLEQTGNQHQSGIGIHTGSDNVVTVLQTGLLGTGNNSLVTIGGPAVPNSDGNEVEITQTSSNTSTVRIDGGANRVTVDQVIQSTSEVGILGAGGGNDNAVSVSQEGFNDSIVSVRGDSNLITVDQTGLGGLLSLNTSGVTIAGALGGDGMGNDVDVTQDGVNASTVDITGDTNIVTVDQIGGNIATVAILGQVGGNGNLLNIGQTGALNLTTVEIHGSDNNGAGFTGGGTADVVATNNALTPGDIFQSGTGNEIELWVGDGAGDSDANAFAFRQSGSLNRISGTIRGGAGNEVAVAQIGSNNLTTFQQIGSFNVLGVNQ